MPYLIILSIFLLLAVVARKERIINPSGKYMSFVERTFVKIAVLLYRIFFSGRAKRNKAECRLMELYPQESSQSLKRNYETNRIKLLIIVIFAGNMAAFLLWISEGTSGLLAEGTYILRKRQGEGSQTVYLTAKGEAGDSAELSLTVRERRYEEAELEPLYKQMLQEALAAALGNNASWEQITEDLYFMNELANYPFFLEWESDNQTVLTGEGKVAGLEDAKNWTEESRLVGIRLTARYYEFEREYFFFARVFPIPKEADFAELAKEALLQVENETGHEDRVVLPGQIGEQAVEWEERQKDGSRSIFWLSCIAGAAVWILKDRELTNAVKKRHVLLEEVYPALISKLTLYLGAGLNLRSAWRKIANEGSAVGGRFSNPLYEEMEFTLREMESGIGEAEAYERFGKRIRKQRYIRLTTLLVQNLQKGNAALLVQLCDEVLMAREEKAAAVRKKGEETGTKLLLPMILMMGMVMVLIMVPAFLSF